MKYLVVFLTILFSFSFSFATTSANINFDIDILWMFQKIVSFLYLIFWPLIFIASKLLSNDFVYGSAFWLDQILWKLWQVVRVLANYVIWFVFLFSIFIYFFKSESNLSWKKLFPKIIIAWIVINLSWFIISALISLSTVLIYWFSSLAISFKENIANVWNQETKIVIPTTVFSGTKIFIKANNTKYEPCVFKINKEWILAKSPANPPCFSLNWWKYVFYNENWQKVSLSSDSLNTFSFSKDIILVNLAKYLYTHFFVVNTKSNSGLAIIYFSKLFLFFIILVPLLVLSVILFIRVLYLWIIIPFSPIIFWAYILGIVPWEYKSKFTEIISLIFQPAYVIFMLGIWFVFIEAVYQMEPWKNQAKFSKTFELKEKWENKLAIWEYIVIEWSKWNWETSDWTSWWNILDYISWLIVNILAWFILWTLVFTALKSNTFTKKISQAVDTYAKQTLKTLPILPDWQSYYSLKEAWNRASINIPKSKLDEQYANLNAAFNKKNNESKNKDTTNKTNENKS